MRQPPRRTKATACTIPTGYRAFLPPLPRRMRKRQWCCPRVTTRPVIARLPQRCRSSEMIFRSPTGICKAEIVLLGWLICISGMNTVRKHLSRVKGGQLAAAHQARMLCLMISDAPGDDPALIGSGPTLGEYATPEKAQAILARWHVPVPGAVRAALSRPSGVLCLDDARLSRVKNLICAAPAQSLDARCSFHCPDRHTSRCRTNLDQCERFSGNPDPLISSVAQTCP